MLDFDTYLEKAYGAAEGAGVILIVACIPY